MLKFVTHALLLVVLFAAALIYRPALHGPFLFDDGPNIVNNQHLRISDLSTETLSAAAFSTPNGLLGRPLSMLSFAFNFYLDRDKIEPFPSAYTFKLTNLVIHLLNGVLVFVLVHLLVTRYRERWYTELSPDYPQWLALAVASAWLVHPLNLTGVLYVVQRMTSLAALFTLAGLCLYCWGRQRLCTGQRGGMHAIMAGLLVCTPLAFLSKENGLLLPLFMLAAELTLFRFESCHLSGRRFLTIFFLGCAALPTLLCMAYVVQHPEFVLSGYARRDFNLQERLMTEARVIWFYLSQIMLPSIFQMGIFHDDIATSRGLLEPITTLPAILGICALAIGAWLVRNRQPLLAFGILFFSIGHGLESTIYPLELVFEHRNYLPMLGILLAFFHMLLSPFRAASARLPRQAAAVLLIGLFAGVTFARAGDWSSPYRLWLAEVEHHPLSVRSNAAMADYYVNAFAFDPATKTNNYQMAHQYYAKVIALDRYSTEGLFGLLRLSELNAKPVDPRWLVDLAYALTHKAIPANTNDHLITLATCGLQAACPLKSSEIESLIHAPLHNPNVAGRDKALIYNALTVYYFKVVRNLAAALEATQQAIALDSHDFVHQFWRVNILIAMNRNDEARSHIARLKQLDMNGMYTRDIAFVEEQILPGN